MALNTGMTGRWPVRRHGCSQPRMCLGTELWPALSDCCQLSVLRFHGCFPSLCMVFLFLKSESVPSLARLSAFNLMVMYEEQKIACCLIFYLGFDSTFCASVTSTNYGLSE